MTCFTCIFCKRNNQYGAHDNKEIPETNNVRIFSYKVLQNATGNFSTANKIGEGGFGSVYRGTLKDGTVIAVKVLSAESSQGVREFLNELSVISGIVHENLVRLYGCCLEGGQRMLVYNCLENNSLAQTLLVSGGRNSNIQFSWKTRSKICIGVAHGLAFLHEEVSPHIVHRDIKASNILLDKDLTPKISDFGLAKLFPPNMTHVSTRVAGTMGYLAPEYAIRGQVTRKSDVYSFGVLLLEIVSGKCNTNTLFAHNDRLLNEMPSNVMDGLLLQTWELYKHGDVSSIIDRSLGDDFDNDEACRFVKVALLCTQDTYNLRPSMSSVVRMLKGEMDIVLNENSTPGLITDFMDLKVRSPKKLTEASTSSTSTGGETSSSGNTTHPSITFTETPQRH